MERLPRPRPGAALRASSLLALVSVLLVTSVLAGLGLGGLGRDAFSDGPDAATIALIDRGRGAERPPVVSVAGTRPRGSTPAQRRTGPAVLWKAYPLDPSTARSP